VVCITYNHANFIRDAIESFLMQETTFPVQIFVHDDASTDGTADIVREYAAKYPQLFWTVLQKENQWSRGNGKILFDYLTQQSGLFIALCEGDDFWTSPDKLEAQVEYMRHNQNCSCCFHLASVIDERGNLTEACSYKPQKTSYSLKECFTQLGKQYATNSMVFRRAALSDAPQWIMQNCNDALLEIQLARHGSVDCVNRTMSCYRIHSHGIWSRLSREQRLQEQVKRYRMLLGAEWLPSDLVQSKINECHIALWRLQHPCLARAWDRIHYLIVRFKKLFRRC
jgi:glycosyltransferase involved in cell wall biosynthesis